MDASFLYIENEFNHMSIAMLSIFEGPPPGEAAIEKMVASSLDRMPRLRQRLRFVPMDMGRPLWCDDPHFSLRYHLRHSALPQPGSDEQLQALMGRVMSQQLDRDRPLWELWLVDGLIDGSWAMLLKIHHSVADGVAAAELMVELLDAKPRVRRRKPAPWTPEEQPTPAERARQAVKEQLGSPRRVLDTLQGAISKPKEAARQASEFFDGVLSMRRPTSLEVESSLNGPIGVQRSWRWVSCSLSDTKRIRSSHGCTVNDVVLAVITEGFRALLVSRGEPIEDHVVRTMVPVSVRQKDEHNVTNNRVSAIYVELPVGIGDPLERLANIHEQTRQLKAHHQAQAADMMMSLSVLSPAALMATGTRFVGSHDMNTFQTIATNVPGPREALYAAGCKLRTVYLYVPITSGVRMGVAIFSYEDELTFAVTGDYDSAPDTGVLCSGIKQGTEDLLALTPVE
jgi:WS/DGAT/MGAT family acyltransferase